MKFRKYHIFILYQERLNRIIKYCFSKDFEDKYHIHFNIDIRNYDGTTLLHIAAKKGDKDMVQFLLSKGIDINIEDDDGNIPLIYSLNGNVDNEICQYLVDRGSKIIVKDIKKGVNIGPISNTKCLFVRSKLSQGNLVKTKIFFDIDKSKRILENQGQFISIKNQINEYKEMMKNEKLEECRGLLTFINNANSLEEKKMHSILINDDDEKDEGNLIVEENN